MLCADMLIICYADNIDLLVLDCSDVSLQEEFYNVKSWAEDNKTLNTGQTMPSSALSNIEQVSRLKSLGVFLHVNLNGDMHAEYILKLCSERIYLIRQLYRQELYLQTMYCVSCVGYITHLIRQTALRCVFNGRLQTGKIR